MLEGFRIIDAANGRSAQLAGVFLAELGADVVRIESQRPATPPPSFWVANRSKRGVRVDGPGPELTALVHGADAIVVDGRPAERARRGLDNDALRALNPGLVIVEASAYGAAPGTDQLPESTILAAALSGHIGSQFAFRDGGMFPVNDFGGATLGVHCASAVVAGLIGRGRDGHARTLSSSALAAWLSLRLFHAVVGPGVGSVSVRDPQGGMSPVSRFYAGSDGRWLMVAANTPVFWSKVCVALDRHDWLTDPRYEHAPFGIAVQDRQPLTDALTTLFATKPRDHWIDVLRAADVPCAPANNLSESLDDPQARANGTGIAVDQPGVGAIRQVGPLIHSESDPPRVRRPVPALDADRAAVFDEWAAATAPTSSAGGSPATAPLAGVRVLEVCNWVAGPGIGTVLSGLGAEVWKVEPRRGDDACNLMFVYRSINPDKRVLRIDLDKPEGAQVFADLVRACDAVYHNQRPTVAAKLGISEAAIRAIKSDIVFHEIDSFGKTGPLAGDPAFDQLVPVRTGLCAQQGGLPSGHAPVLHNGSQGDLPAAYVGALAVLSGLLHRQRGARPAATSSVLMEAGYLLGIFENVSYPGVPAPMEGGVDFLGPDPAHRLYRAAGDGWVVLAADDEETWARVATLTGLALPPLHDVVAMPSDAPLAVQLGEVFATDTDVSWQARAFAAGAPIARSVPDREVCLTPEVTANGHDHRVVIDGGDAYVYPGSFIATEGYRRDPSVRPAPDPAGDLAHVLRTIGYDDARIDALRASGVAVL